MELTPIKVRGKRRVGDQPAIEPPQKHFRKGRSAKTESKARRPKFSNLEKSLPLEVLEQIFWLSENVNFPRASPRLGRLLSGPATLRETFIRAFSPSWDLLSSPTVEGCSAQCSHCFDARANTLVQENHTGHGNPDFQNALLACTWATIDMILDCWDAWVRRNTRDNIRLFWRGNWGDPLDSPPYANSSLLIGASQLAEARHDFYRDYYAFRNVEKLGSPESNGQPWCDPYVSGEQWFPGHWFTHIPDDLLIGPWDEPSLQKFFWLVRAGARMSSEQTWEITHKAFSNAVNLNSTPAHINMTVIRLLYILRAFVEWPENTQAAELSKLADARRRIGNRSEVEQAKFAYIISVFPMRLFDFRLSDHGE
ncbi:hypothetical protein F5Y08DRAFT_86002 [Xylaria arbuscula]|nr:hypothetical protein F5Y08DRAFT_86002 [Xylaria arbuscula]